jgi:hypothetical protein
MGLLSQEKAQKRCMVQGVPFEEKEKERRSLFSKLLQNYNKNQINHS